MLPFSQVHFPVLQRALTCHPSFKVLLLFLLLCKTYVIYFLVGSTGSISSVTSISVSVVSSSEETPQELILPISISVGIFVAFMTAIFAVCGCLCILVKKKKNKHTNEALSMSKTVTLKLIPSIFQLHIHTQILMNNIAQLLSKRESKKLR